MTEKARSWNVNTGRDWKKGGTRDDAQAFDATAQPAKTVDGKGRWQVSTARSGDFDPAERPAVTVGVGKDRWAVDRPATTIAGDPRVFPPGGHIANDGRDNEQMVGRAEGAIRVTVEDAAVLQGFPRDYPFQGNRSKQFEQVGNAVPPPLARAVVAALVGAEVAS